MLNKSNNTQMKKLNYQEFIKEALYYVSEKPTKSEMEFAYAAMYCGIGWSVEKSIRTSVESYPCKK
jgi:hypothetical protein